MMSLVIKQGGAYSGYLIGQDFEIHSTICKYLIDIWKGTWAGRYLEVQIVAQCVKGLLPR